jgi:hypothetical protein
LKNSFPHSGTSNSVNKNKRIKISSISLLTILTLVTACEPQNSLAPQPNIINSYKRVSKTRVTGKAEFPNTNDLSIKANISDVIPQATVSIIYLPNHPTLANKTVATGLTDNTGNFIINPDASFSPAANDTFILETEKRIGRNNQDKLNISTYIMWNGSAWESMTSPGILINTKTTALTIIAGFNTATITPADTINSIVNGTPQNINATVTGQTVLDVAALVNTVITNNYDPIQYIGFQNSNYLIINPQPLPTPTPTAVPFIGQFQVNTYTTIYQNYSSVALDNAGDFIISWGSFQQDGNDTGVYAQRYNAYGQMQGTEFRVSITTIGAQADPSVGLDSDGDFVITWESQGQDGNNYGVYARRYNSSGVALSSEIRVNTYTTSFQRNPSLGMDSAGNYVIAWESNLQDSDDKGIYAQMYNSNGGAAGIEFKVNSTVVGAQAVPAVAMNKSGSFIVTWAGNGSNDTAGIFAQRYNNSGVAQGGEFRVNSTTAGLQFNPMAAIDGSGNFIITWSSDGQDGSGVGVYAQRYNANGTTQGGEFKVNTTTNGSQTLPAVAMDSNGDFIISWADYTAITGGIFAQRYNNIGSTVGDEFKVSTINIGTSSSIAIDDTGRFIISWHAFTDGDNAGVYAQRYNSSGTPL